MDKQSLAIKHQIEEAIESVLLHARKLGATDTVIHGHISKGLAVCVRKGQPENVEHHLEKSVGIEVYIGKRRGSAATSDISANSISQALEKACSIAKFMESDRFSGLPEKEHLAFDCSAKPLDLYHPWNPSPQEAIELALRCEKEALSQHPTTLQSEGAAVSTSEAHYFQANSLGFLGQYSGTKHSISCALLAKKNQEMQRDYDFTIGRAFEDLISPEEVAKSAVKKTIQRLGARTLSTRKAPVLFSPSLAKGLIAHLCSAISGGKIYRKSSFLVGQLGKPVLPCAFSVDERPYIPKGEGSAPFDAEGVKTRPQFFVKEGILQSYILGSYSARRLGLETTGNAGGVHNLFITTGEDDLKALFKKMGTGLWVTELIGQGVNIINGDYSRGAFGYWIENGEIQYPVEEITIAGNLKDMLLNIVAIGNDVDQRSNIKTGSILVPEMTIAGKHA